jgi:hypothetical protein
VQYLDPYNSNRFALQALDYGGPSSMDVFRAYGDGQLEFTQYAGGTNGRVLFADVDGLIDYLSVSALVLEDHFDGTDVVVPTAGLFSDYLFVSGIQCAVEDPATGDTALAIGANSTTVARFVDPVQYGLDPGYNATSIRLRVDSGETIGDPLPGEYTVYLEYSSGSGVSTVWHLAIVAPVIEPD